MFGRWVAGNVERQASAQLAAASSSRRAFSVTPTADPTAFTRAPPAGIPAAAPAAGPGAGVPPPANNIPLTIAAPWTFRRVAGALFFTGTSLLTTGLCAWQIQRHFWKKELLASREAGLALPPVPLEQHLPQLVGTAWDAFLASAAAFRIVDLPTSLELTAAPRHVTLRGRFDYAREQLVGFAAPPLDTGNVKKGDAVRGYYVCTPLMLAPEAALALPLRPTMPVLPGAPTRPSEVLIRNAARAAMPPAELAALPPLPDAEAFAEAALRDACPRDDVVALHTAFPTAESTAALGARLSAESGDADAAAAGVATAPGLARAAQLSPVRATVCAQEVLVNRGWIPSTHALSYLASNRLPEPTDAELAAEAASAADNGNGHSTGRDGLTAAADRAAATSALVGASNVRTARDDGLSTVTGVFWFGPRRSDSTPPTLARVKDSPALAHQIAYPSVLAAAAQVPAITITAFVDTPAAPGAGPHAQAAAAEVGVVLETAAAVAAARLRGERELESLSRKVAAAALEKERLQLLQDGKDASQLPVVAGLTEEERADALGYRAHPTQALRDLGHTLSTAAESVVAAGDDPIGQGTWAGAIAQQGGALTAAFEAVPVVEMMGAAAGLVGRSQRVVAKDTELGQATSVRMQLLRKSEADYFNFHSMPATHIVYAATWGTLSAVGYYMAYTRFWRKRVYNPALFKSFK